MTSLERCTFDWPDQHRFYLTLDLECDFGTALSTNTYHALKSVDRLADILNRFDVPLTCFVQTEVLDEDPEQVEQLRESVNVMFHPHSHTHKPRAKIDVGEEITTSTERYQSFFGTRPTGYRLPNGNVRSRDYRLLADHGYKFDASLFPSWRPNHFDNTDALIVPHHYSGPDLFEIPFTVYSDSARVPTAHSYCRLLGRPFTWLLTRRPPQVVIFNIHMHDLVTPPSYHDLPPIYKAVYTRNNQGFKLLKYILEQFDSLEYTFGTLNELHEKLRVLA